MRRALTAGLVAAGAAVIGALWLGRDAIWLLAAGWQHRVQDGMAGAVAMALGTAMLTLAVAVFSVSLRRGALAALPGGPLLRRAAGLAELALGLAVVLGAALMRGAA